MQPASQSDNDHPGRLSLRPVGKGCTAVHDALIDVMWLHTVWQTHCLALKYCCMVQGQPQVGHVNVM